MIRSTLLHLGRLVVLASLAFAASGDETETLWLSGRGPDDAVPWEFFVSEGRRSGAWTTLPVPSQWELHGFGRYNYGHDDDKSREEGRYRHRFTVPAAWSGRRVDLVFEGVMTDAEVTVNGESAGPRHQGGFYRFAYDVSGRLRYGAVNLLEVTVAKHSQNRSVNRAERDADYWLFGGIFRPVYLAAAPPESIRHLALDARHDGRLRLLVEVAGLAAPAEIVAQVETLAGDAVGALFTAALAAGGEGAELTTTVAAIEAWSAERPRLYRLRLVLRRGAEVLHSTSERFGFRSVEVRAGEGLFVNGQRVRLKGVNRHAFWPDRGRTLRPEESRQDVVLMKAMNLNAVRTAHYPPDVDFLAACDELGLYVLDELAGWHDAYDDKVGRRLVGEMLRRDVNHPSILAWNNGNEGGWNSSLDAVFADHDPQRRPVLHPGDFAAGFDNRHYPTWKRLADALDPASLGNRWRGLFGPLPLVMPTEMLHGLYDGGSGAGLEGYWQLLRRSPRGVGAFLWSWSDEAVVRSDRNGALDSDGNHAPDGILGPYREPTGTALAVRQTFSPIVVRTRRLASEIVVENRYDLTDLADCRFRWELVELPRPGAPAAPLAVLASGEESGPRVAPGASGRLRLPLPAAPGPRTALRLTAFDPDGRDVWTWVLPAGPEPGPPDLDAATTPVTARVAGEILVLETGTRRVEIDLRSGELHALEESGRRLPLAGGPRRADGSRARRAHVQHFRDGKAYVVALRYADGLDLVRWKLFPSGWLHLLYQLPGRAGAPYQGIGFTWPDDDLLRVRWLGRGPARVWGNRLQGGTLGLWEKAKTEPEFAGFYAGVRWATLETRAGELTLMPEEGLFLGLLAPDFPADAEEAVAEVPPGGITLLDVIPSIGTKFHAAPELAPPAEAEAGGTLRRGSLWMLAGPVARPEP